MRHLNVEKKQIGLQFPDFFQPQLGVIRHSHHGYIGRRHAQHIGERFGCVGFVVNEYGGHEGEDLSCEYLRI